MWIIHKELKTNFATSIPATASNKRTIIKMMQQQPHFFLPAFERSISKLAEKEESYTLLILSLRYLTLKFFIWGTLIC